MIVLDLVTFSAMARTFDQISDDGGQTWPATDFVNWLVDEVRASPEPEAPEAPVGTVRRS